MKGAEDSIFAIGDCTSTAYAPTAQVATQEGAYLARVLAQLAKKDKLEADLALAADGEKPKIQRQLEKIEKFRPFHYSHQGSLAYIGSDKAIADLPFWDSTVSADFWGMEGLADFEDSGRPAALGLTCSGGART